MNPTATTATHIRVLMVDDDENDVLLTRRLLSQAGQGEFVVDWARNWDETLARAQARDFDVCLMDLRLGGHSGIELMEAMREHACEAPVILLTGHSDYAIDLEAMRRGAAEFLSKDELTPALLERTIRYTLLHARDREAIQQANQQLEQKVRERTSALEASTESLRRSEAEYRAIFDLASAGKTQCDPETGRFLRVNRSFRELTGYDEMRLLGMTLAELTHPDHRGADAAAYARLLADEIAVFDAETRYQRADGSAVWVRSTYSVVRDEQGRALYTIGDIQDITPRRRAQEALRASEARLRRLVDSNILGIVFADDAGAIHGANDAFLSLVGYSREELESGRVRWADLTPPEYLHLDLLGVQEARLRGACTPYEKEYIRKNGARIPILIGFARLDEPLREPTAPHIEAGHPQAGEAAELRATTDYVCFVLDLTERRMAERALRQSEERFRRLIETSTFGLMIGDLQGRVSYANPMLLQMLGFTAGEVQAGKLRSDQVTPPEFSEADARAAHELVANGYSTPYEKIFLTREGRRLPVYVGGAVIDRTSQGDPIVASFVMDLTPLKRAEQALRESEHRLLAIIDHADLAFSVKDLSGHFLLVNQYYCTLFNQVRDEVQGGTDYDLFAPVLADAYRANDRRVIETGQTLRFEENVMTGERMRIYLSVKFPLRDEAGAIYAICSFSTDITERKAMEQALAISEERFRLLARATNEVIRDWDLVSDEMVWNEGIRSMFGYARCQVGGSGAWWEEHIHLEDAAAVMQSLREVFDRPDQPTWTAEYRFRRLDGSYANVLDRAYIARGSEGQPLRLISTMLDLTERKRAEDALRESEERFRGTFENVAVGITHVDARGRWLRLNRTFCEMTGHTREELEQLTFQEISHPDDLPKDLELFQRLIQGEIDFYDMEKRYFHKNGQVIWAYLTRSLQRDETGRPLYAITSMLDITARKKMETALRDADRRKDEFLAMLAHELRNPLAPIRYSVQMLGMAEPLSPMMAKQRDIIERQVSHMARLLDDLLDVSRITRGKIHLQRERIDLRQVVENVIESSRELIATHNLEFTYAPAPSPLWIDADPTRMEQIVRNLLVNAVKYTERNGRIGVTVAAEWVSAPEAPEGAGAAAAVPMAVVRVWDGGIGIAPEMLPRVFDLFIQADQSLDRSQGGLGIGLTMVQQLVQAHGGTVHAHSEGLGKGSEFIVRMPLIEAIEPGTAQAERVIPAAPQIIQAPSAGRKRVLVVDDNVDAATSLAELIDMWGFDVHIAHDGPAAIQNALDHPPDIVLLDIGLPGMNGYEVARFFRATPAIRHTLLLALTGYGQEEDRRKSEQAGFDRHFTKPVNLDDLQRMLEPLRA